MRHRGDIQGLRALSVAAVVAYHAGAGWMRGGYSGVDVFFVISGFLITGVLTMESDGAGRISLREFWARRSRRIVPMAALVAVVTLVAGVFMLEDGRLGGTAAETMGALGFSANIVLHLHSSVYLSGVTLPSPVQHYWSLAVEEQFYLFWPLVFLGVTVAARARRRIALVAVTSGLTALSLAASVLLTRGHPGASYYLPHTRVWEILAGALLALCWPRVESVDQRIRAVAGWCGLAAIIWSFAAFDAETVFPGSAALLPVLGAVAVLAADSARRGPARVLVAAPAQWIGARSYSLYLWHWPALVLVEARFGALTAVGTAVVIAASTGLSALSYSLVEQPVRRQPWLSARASRSVVAALATVAVTVAAAGIVWSVAPPAPAVADESVAEQLDANPGTSGSLPAVKDTPHVLLLGDSVLAGLRWWADGSKSLTGFDWVLDAEPCRRILYFSCTGREDREPPTAVAAFRSYTQRFDVVVVVAGYHSRHYQFEEEVTQLLDEVRATGARVVFLSLKESLAYPERGSQGRVSAYAAFNKKLKNVIERRADPGILLADWNYLSRNKRAWFGSDNLHTRLKGTLALGWYISHAVAAVTGRACPFDPRTPCPVPVDPPDSMDWLGRFGAQDTTIRCYEMGESRKRVCDG